MPWLGDAEAYFVSGTGETDTLYIFGVRPMNAGQIPEEIVRLRVPFNGPGAYQLPWDAVEYTVLVGGDVASAQYAGQQPTAGTLTLDAYDAAAGRITGMVVFDAVATSESHPYGPAARFEEGQFRVSVDPAVSWGSMRAAIGFDPLLLLAPARPSPRHLYD
jgi:hypothetical protein